MRVLLVAPDDRHSALYLAKAFKQLGHDVEQFDHRESRRAHGSYSMNKSLQSLRLGVDLTVVLGGDGLFPSSLKGTVLWCFDSWYAFDPALLSAARAAKVFLTPSDGLVEGYRLEGINAKYLAEGADPDLHHQVEPTSFERVHYGSDVSFVGTVLNIDGRAEWLVAIGQKFGLKIWGSYGTTSTREWHTGMRAEGDEQHNLVVSSSKMMLDRTRTPNISGAISARVYRTMAAKGCLLMYAQVDLGRYISPSSVAVYSDNAECLEAIRALLADPEKRRKMAEHAYFEFLEKHTWRLRAEQLLRLSES